MPEALVLPPSAHRAFGRLAGDLKRVLGSRFVALVASGPGSSVAFARSIDAADLDAMSALVEVWHRDELDTPLLLTPDEFRRSLDAFPAEYQAIVDRHVVVAGEPPFDGETVASPAALRRACEAQAKSHLLHLRQGWLEAAGNDDDLAALIARSATPLRAVLANVARLFGVPPHDGTAALAGAGYAGLPADLVAAILTLEHAPDDAHALVERLPAYLAAAEQLWRFVDQWPA